jgi:hypothetical protein
MGEQNVFEFNFNPGCIAVGISFQKDNHLGLNFILPFFLFSIYFHKSTMNKWF